MKSKPALHLVYRMTETNELLQRLLDEEAVPEIGRPEIAVQIIHNKEAADSVVAETSSGAHQAVESLVAGVLNFLSPNEIPFHPMALLNTSQVAELLDVREATLEKWRLTGGGPPYVKLSGKVVRYSVSSLAEWIESHTKQNTSEAP